MDDNDRLRAGTLPRDPEGDAVPMPPPDGEAKQEPTARPIGQLIDGAYQTMMRRANREETPIPTPWKGLSVALHGGWWPGLYTLTSASGTGKTQFAIQSALAAARGGKKVVYVALELGATDLVARVLGVMADRKWSTFFYGEDKSGLVAALAEHGRELGGLPLIVEVADAIGWSYRNLQALAAEHRPDMIVLDYAQLVFPPEGAREELRQTIGNVAKVGRDLARSRGIAVLALSSTARTNYGAVDGASGTDDKKAQQLGQGDPARFIGLGKESGELEFTADCVLALARERVPDGADPTDERPTWVAIAKGRGFPTGWVKLSWDGSRFSEERVGHEY